MHESAKIFYSESLLGVYAHSAKNPISLSVPTHILQKTVMPNLIRHPMAMQSASIPIHQRCLFFSLWLMLWIKCCFISPVLSTGR
jgi:hypothetical protein